MAQVHRILWLISAIFALAILYPVSAAAQTPEGAVPPLPPLPELPVADGTRVALVIGNSGYAANEAWKELPNAARDALYVADRLRNPVSGAGRFEVLLLIDADYERMRAGVDRFKAMAATADIALVYYAGHGFEFNLNNYLVPVDAPPVVSERRLDRTHIAMKDVIAASTAKQLSLFFLDACRTTDALRNTGDNPEGNRASMFGAIDADGSGVIYSAGRGQSAYDAAPAGDTQSPFAKAVIRFLSYPGLEFDDFYRLVAQEVKQATKDLNPDQYPASAMRMTSRFYMVPRATPERLVQESQIAVAASAAAPSPRPQIDWEGYERCRRGEMDQDGIQIPVANCQYLFGLSEPEPQAGTASYSSGSIMITLPSLTPLDIAAELIERTDDTLLVMDILEDYSMQRLEALSAQDDPLAAYILGTMYFEGITVPRDTTLASEQFERAAATGNPVGQYGLARFLERMTFEYNVAVEGAGRITDLYRSAHQQGFAKASIRLANLYAEGLIALPDDNPDENIDIWQAMAANGHAGSHFELLYRDIEPDVHFAALQDLADGGDGEAALWLCRLDDNRQGTKARLDRCFEAALDGHEMAVVAMATDILSRGSHGLSRSDLTYWARQALGNPLLPDQWIPCMEGIAATGEIAATCDLSGKGP